MHLKKNKIKESTPKTSGSQGVLEDTLAKGGGVAIFEEGRRKTDLVKKNK